MTNETAEELETTLRRLAASGDAAQLQVLTARLGDPAVLERLDPPVDGYRPMGRLLAVLDTLHAHPNEHTEALAHALLRDPDFSAVPQRLPALYRALTAVVPTSKENATVLRSAIAAGFYPTLAPNLAENGSPRALELLAAILLDPSIDGADRVEAARHSLLPRRTDSAILTWAAALLDSLSDPLIEIAVIESIFDYQPGPWFGKSATQPVPPPWNTLDHSGKLLLLTFGRAVLERKGLPPTLRSAVKTTVERVRATEPSSTPSPGEG